MQNGRLRQQKLNTMKARVSLLKHIWLKIEDTCKLCDTIYIGQFRMHIVIAWTQWLEIEDTYKWWDHTYSVQFRMQFAESAKKQHNRLGKRHGL